MVRDDKVVAGRSREYYHWRAFKIEGDARRDTTACRAMKKATRMAA